MNYRRMPGQARRRGATRALGDAPIEIATYVNGAELIPTRETSIEGCIPGFVGWFGGMLLRRPLTLYSYSGHLRDFAAWARARHVLFPRDVTFRMLEDYFRDLTAGRGLKVETAFARVAALRRFWQYLTREAIVPHDITQLLVLPKFPKHRRLPRVIPPDGPTGQDAMLRALAQDQTLRGQRDYAIIAVEQLAGLRVSEVCRLAVEDVDFDAELIYVNDSKGGKSRQVYLAPRLARILRHYGDVVRPALLDRRGFLHQFPDSKYWHARWHTPDGTQMRRTTRTTDRAEAERILRALAPEKPPTRFLFVHAGTHGVSHGDRPLDPRSVLHVVKRRVVPIIGRNCWNHLIRHSYATRLRTRGAPLEILAEQMGHESLDTTRIYAQLLPDEMRKQMAKYLAEPEPPQALPAVSEAGAEVEAKTRPDAGQVSGDRVNGGCAPTVSREVARAADSVGFTLERRRALRERRQVKRRRRS